MRYLFWLGLIFLLNSCTPLDYVNSLVSTSMRLDKNIAYGSLDSQTLDIYTRPDIKSQGVVIFVHGGYWDSDDKSNYAFLADSLSEYGFITVVPNYRLVPLVTFPSYVEDVAMAVAWSLQNIETYGGNPEKVFVMGHSAGAHIASLVTFDERYLKKFGLTPNKLEGFIGLAGPYDFLPLAPDDIRSKAALGPEENWQQTQPIHFVDGNELDTLLIYSPTDTVVNPNNSIRFAEKIREKGGQVIELSYEGVDHSTILGALARGGRILNTRILKDVLAFLRSK